MAKVLANDESTRVFALALQDRFAPVRNMALHSIACETCRTEALCVADVVPRLIDVLTGDPDVELRHKTIPVLLRFDDRDSRAERRSNEQRRRTPTRSCVRSRRSRCAVSTCGRARPTGAAAARAAVLRRGDGRWAGRRTPLTGGRRRPGPLRSVVWP